VRGPECLGQASECTSRPKKRVTLERQQRPPRKSPAKWVLYDTSRRRPDSTADYEAYQYHDRGSATRRQERHLGYDLDFEPGRDAATRAPIKAGGNGGLDLSERAARLPMIALDQSTGDAEVVYTAALGNTVVTSQTLHEVAGCASTSCGSVLDAIEPGS